MAVAERLWVEWDSETALARALRQRRLARLDRLLGRIEEFNADCGMAVCPDSDLLLAFQRLGGFLPGPLAMTGGELLDAVLDLQLGLMRRPVSDAEPRLPTGRLRYF